MPFSIKSHKDLIAACGPPPADRKKLTAWKVQWFLMLNATVPADDVEAALQHTYMIIGADHPMHAFLPPLDDLTDDDAETFFERVQDEAFPPEDYRRLLVGELASLHLPKHFTEPQLREVLTAFELSIRCLADLNEDYTDKQKMDMLINTISDTADREAIREDLNVNSFAEAKSKLLRKAKPAPTGQRTTQRSSAPPATLHQAGMGRGQNNRTNQTRSVPDQPRTPLTPEERARCDALGLCYICRQEGHMANACPRRRNRFQAPAGTANLHTMQAAATGAPNQGNAQPSG